MGDGRLLQGLQKDGQLIDIEIALAPLTDPTQKRTTAVVASVIDIRERIATENLLKQQLEQITHVNKELDQFAYVASHDLKAPMRGIRQLVNWINSDPNNTFSERTQRHLGLLDGRVARLQGLLSSLLDYSRVGRRGTKVETFEPQACLQDVWSLLSPPEGFEFEIKNIIPELTTDKAAFEQVMMNILGNSIKHHDQKRGHITLDAVAEDHYFKFSIADDGPGIEPRFHDKIFEMFQTLKPRDEVEGSGMGLSLVKKAIEQLGGRLSIVSEPETSRGTVFEIYWPKHTKNGGEQK